MDHKQQATVLTGALASVAASLATIARNSVFLNIVAILAAGLSASLAYWFGAQTQAPVRQSVTVVRRPTSSVQPERTQARTVASSALASPSINHVYSGEAPARDSSAFLLAGLVASLCFVPAFVLLMRFFEKNSAMYLLTEWVWFILMTWVPVFTGIAAGRFASEIRAKRANSSSGVMPSFAVGVLAFFVLAVYNLYVGLTIFYKYVDPPGM